MLCKTEFDELLHCNGLLIIDGGLATELERRGYDLSHPLWSGRLLQDDKHAIASVHHDFYEAGADIAITASYQTSVRGLIENLDVTPGQAENLIRDSVAQAKIARSKLASSHLHLGRRLLIAGSVGPYGAYLCDGSEYSGDYSVSGDELKDFHRQRIRALIEGGADLLALETMPNMVEIEALLGLITAEFPDAIAWLSCTLRDTEHISDGTPVADVVSVVGNSTQVVAFGVNCVEPTLVNDFLARTRSQTTIPLLCYPNSGEKYDAVSKAWSARAGGDVLQRSVKDWHLAGATLIGGCCRTTTEDVKELSRELCEKS